ncbi:M23 family metallopeptidase [Aquihabitans sp. G128]|uniref:M23 family metallopeptidase n=1 Tax=Aquihabitans sp. G128 TaxID=2849779 RepID=UPI001C2219CD|nr:M23 family metallopeptidase [Aquihabitans sp. G128]QXC60608.1 M23 family metallopeptidase [Aquihabitans sp. G128]
MATGTRPSSATTRSPVDRSWWERHPEWFTKPHHDYPAADIPVPTGTPLYAITSGTIVSTTTSGRCGYGITLNGDDGAQYTYCHGKPGSHQVSVGDTMSPGQVVMESASTGNSTGPHLHFAIRIDGASRCPQDLLVSIAEGRSKDPQSLPTAGCNS